MTKVLLVDDDSDLLQSVKDGMAIHSQFDFDLALSAEEAFKKIENMEYDAIVCDIQMPVMDGFEFLKSLRKMGNNVPFIVFTVTDKSDIAIKAFRLGADGFVGKFGQPRAVFSTLSRCIDNAIYRKIK